MTAAYKEVISASPRDRLDLFLGAANRLGASIGNIEKDFWVCWTLNALYHERPAGGPRLLFKGGTSLSKNDGLNFDALIRDYANMTAIIFGPVPMFEELVESASRIARIISRRDRTNGACGGGSNCCETTCTQIKRVLPI